MTSRVLLVGLDGARRSVLSSLMDRGAMPRLARLVETGCSGALIARPPHGRAMSWTTLATGVHPPTHGVFGDVEVRDDGAGVRPTGHGAWRAPAIWQLLATVGARSAVVAWPGTAPASSWGDIAVVDERFAQPLGLQPDAWPLMPECIAPATSRERLRALRVHPAQITARQLCGFVPGIAQVDQDNDPRLAQLAVALSRAATIHAAATLIAEERDWELCCVVYPFLAEISGSFKADRASVDASAKDDAGLYAGVADAAYRFTDAMLGTLLDGVDPETIVMLVSPPGPAGDGFFAASGPGVRRDELVHGASLVDVAATVMNVFDLRAGHLEGMPLDAVSRPLASKHLAQDLAHVSPLPSNDVALDVVHRSPDDDAASDADPGLTPKQRQAVQSATLRWMANAAESFLAAGRFDEAATRYARIVAVVPHDWVTRARLARCHLHLGHHAECLALARALVEERPDDPWGHLLAAAAHVLRGDAAGARPHLGEASAHGLDRPAIAVRLGMLHLASGEWAEAETSFRRSLRDAAESAEALDGLGCALHAQGRYAEAEQAFRAALGVNFRAPLAHAHLALSLASLRRFDEAARAAATALEQDPTVPGAKALLERVRAPARGALPA